MSATYRTTINGEPARIRLRVGSTRHFYWTDCTVEQCEGCGQGDGDYRLELDDSGSPSRLVCEHCKADYSLRVEA